MKMSRIVVTVLLCSLPVWGTACPASRNEFRCKQADVCNVEVNGQPYNCISQGCGVTECAECCWRYVNAPADPATCNRTSTNPSYPNSCFNTPTQWQQSELLSFHNDIRADHGSPPLVWNQQIAEVLRDSTAMEDACTVGFTTHNDLSNFDAWDHQAIVTEVFENINLNFNMNQRWTGVENGADKWYCEQEGCWNYAFPSEHVLEKSVDFRNIVVASVTEMACAMCSSSTTTPNVEMVLLCAYKTGNPIFLVFDDFSAVKPITCRNGGHFDRVTNQCSCPPERPISIGIYNQCPGQFETEDGNQVECIASATYTGEQCGREAFLWGDVHMEKVNVNLNIEVPVETTFILFEDSIHTFTATIAPCFGNSSSCIVHLAVYTATHVTEFSNKVVRASKFAEITTDCAGGRESYVYLSLEQYYINSPQYPFENIFIVGDGPISGETADLYIATPDGLPKLYFKITSVDVGLPSFHLDVKFEYVGSDDFPIGLLFDPDYDPSRTAFKWIDNSGRSFCWPRKSVDCPDVGEFPEWKREFKQLETQQLDCSSSNMKLALDCCEEGANCPLMHQECIVDACRHFTSTGGTTCPTDLIKAFQLGDSLQKESCYCHNPHQSVVSATGKCDSCRSHWYPTAFHLRAKGLPTEGACTVNCIDSDCDVGQRCNADGTCQKINDIVAEQIPRKISHRHTKQFKKGKPDKSRIPKGYFGRHRS